MIRQTANRLKLLAALVIAASILIISFRYFGNWYPGRQFILITSDQYKWPEKSIFAISPNDSRMKRIAEGFDPACSPDGRRIAFVNSEDANRSSSHDYTHVFVMNSDGSNTRQVTSGTGYVGQPSWSPDGRRIVFETDTIEILDLDTLDITRPFVESNLTVSDPAWMPTGDRIIFSMYNVEDDSIGLYISDTEGNSIEQLTEGDDEKPSPSSDGQAVAYIHHEMIRETEEIVVLRILDVHKKTWHDIEFPPDVTFDSGPKWSPDGQQIIIAGSHYVDSLLGGEIRSAIYSINVGNSGISIVFTANNSTWGVDPPGWLPAPRTIIFSSVEWCEVK